MKALRALALAIFISLFCVTQVFAAGYTNSGIGVDFAVPEVYTCITPDTIKQNAETVEQLGHSVESLKAFMADNDLLLLAVMPQNAAQLQLRVTRTEFSKDILSLDGLDTEHLNRIGEKLADNFTLQTENGITYFKTVQSGTGYGTVQFITVKNGAVYQLLYYGTSMAEANAALRALQISDTHAGESGRGMNIFLSIVIAVVILLAVVAIGFLIYSFYKDLKNRYGEHNDVREYIRIKRRKF